eukprot:3157714-Pyramimonas_sp.AAC.1
MPLGKQPRFCVCQALRDNLGRFVDHRAREGVGGALAANDEIDVGALQSGGHDARCSHWTSAAARPASVSARRRCPRQ